MSKTVVINLGSGDLKNGFSRVTTTVRAAGHPLPEQFVGNLPAAPDLVELYRNWRSIYQNLCDRKQLLSAPKMLTIANIFFLLLPGSVGAFQSTG